MLSPNTFTSLLLLGCGLAAAHPTRSGSKQASHDKQHSPESYSSMPPSGTVKGDAGCTFTDAEAAVASKASCSNIVLKDIAVPEGMTLDLTELKDGTTVTFEGKTTFGYKEWAGPLIKISGTNINVTGASGHILDGEGARWWDGLGSNGGKTKPKFFAAHKLIDSTISNLNIQNHPVQCFSVNTAQNLHIKDITIDNSAGDELGSDGKALGHNTDAFDVGSSTGVYISGANVTNQDDCLAINSGTDISFTGCMCSGGHGASIGSVGGRINNDVENVYIANNTIANSDNGIRIKTVYGATGSVKNITYSDITLTNITKYGIVIEQDYQNGSPTGTPTDGVPITDITIENVKGTVAAEGENVYILCASCSAWKWTGVEVTGGKTSSKCTGVPDGATY